MIMPFDPDVINVAFYVAVGIVTIALVLITGKSTLEWFKNANSPRETERAVVLAKRERNKRERRYDGATPIGYTAVYTTYLVTFETERGARMELKVPDYEYGLLVTGDEGELTHRGTQFISFERLGASYQ